MFTNVNQVSQITGKTVTPALIMQAQNIIEVFAGRAEGEIESARDQYLLGMATAYQAVYMLDNGETVFTQVDMSTLGQGNLVVRFPDGSDAPYIAPLAEVALRGVSWKKSNSVHIGGIFGGYGYPSDWWFRD